MTAPYGCWTIKYQIIESDNGYKAIIGELSSPEDFADFKGNDDVIEESVRRDISRRAQKEEGFQWPEVKESIDTEVSCEFSDQLSILTY